MIKLIHLSRMLRGALVAAALCWIAPTVHAAQAEALVVYPAGGSELVFFLGDHPVLNYTDTKVTIESTTAKAELELSQAGTMKFEMREPSSVTDATHSVSVDLSDPAAVRVLGLQPGQQVTAVTLSGLTVCNSTADSDGTATLPLHNLAPGTTVIITSNTLTFKLIKK